MGAVAIRIHGHNFLGPYKELKREFSDIDFVAYWRQDEQVKVLNEELGYVPREQSLGTMFLTRHVFYDQPHKRVAEVFHKLRMCHTINFQGRLELDFPTILLTDLFLTKMQIVKPTEKDARDLRVLLREHEADEQGSATREPIALSLSMPS